MSPDAALIGAECSLGYAQENIARLIVDLRIAEDYLHRAMVDTTDPAYRGNVRKTLRSLSDIQENLEKLIQARLRHVKSDVNAILDDINAVSSDGEPPDEEVAGESEPA